VVTWFLRVLRLPVWLRAGLWFVTPSARFARRLRALRRRRAIASGIFF
jgi:hypothetical protein